MSDINAIFQNGVKATRAGSTLTVEAKLDGTTLNLDSSGQARVAPAALSDAQIAAANKDGTAATPSLRTLGTGAQQACAGSDARLSDARTPSAHTHPLAQLTQSGASNGQVPAWSTASSAWVPATPSTGASDRLNDQHAAIVAQGLDGSLALPGGCSFGGDPSNPSNLPPLYVNGSGFLANQSASLSLDAGTAALTAAVLRVLSNINGLRIVDVTDSTATIDIWPNLRGFNEAHLGFSKFLFLDLASTGGIVRSGGSSILAFLPTGGVRIPNGSAPSAQSGTAAFYCLSGQMYVQDQLGNTTLLSPHALDAPPGWYDQGAGLDNIERKANVYKAQIIWQHNDRIARIASGELASFVGPAYLVETFAQYAARAAAYNAALPAGEPRREPLLARDWDADEETARVARQAQIDIQLSRRGIASAAGKAFTETPIAPYAKRPKPKWL